MSNKILTVSNYDQGYIKVTCECNSYLVGLEDPILSIVSIEEIDEDGFVVALCKVKDFEKPLIKWIPLGNMIQCKDKHCSHPGAIKKLKLV